MLRTAYQLLCVGSDVVVGLCKGIGRARGLLACVGVGSAAELLQRTALSPTFRGYVLQPGSAVCLRPDTCWLIVTSCLDALTGRGRLYIFAIEDVATDTYKARRGSAFRFLKLIEEQTQ